MTTALTHSALAEEEDPVPLVANIELTNRCNLRCRICANRTMKRPRRDMNLQLYRVLLGKLEQAGVRQVILNTIGETLLYPWLDEALAMAKGHGFYVLVSTNGQLLDESAARMLFARNCDLLRISIEGADARRYEAIRSGGSFATLIANVGRLKPLRAECSASTAIRIRSTISTRSTPQERCRFLEYWAPYVDLVEFITFGNMGGQVGGPDLRADRRRPCATMWRGINVLYDGRVSRCPCDFDARFVVGSLVEATLDELWFGEAYREARLLHKALDFRSMPSCEICSATHRSWYESRVPALTKEEEAIMGLYQTDAWQ